MLSVLAVGLAAGRAKGRSKQAAPAAPLALQATAFAGASLAKPGKLFRFSDEAMESLVVMHGWNKEAKPRKPLKARRQKLDRSRGPLNYCPAKYKDRYYLRRAQRPSISAKKRFLVKEDGTIWRRQAGLSHLVSKKGTKRIKRLEKMVRILPCHYRRVRKLLHVSTPTQKPWDFIMKKFPEKRLKDCLGMEDRLVGTRMWTGQRDPGTGAKPCNKTKNMQPIDWGPEP